MKSTAAPSRRSDLEAGIGSHRHNQRGERRENNPKWDENSAPRLDYSCNPSTHERHLPIHWITEFIGDARRWSRLEFAPRFPPWSRLVSDQTTVSRLRRAVTRHDSFQSVSRSGRAKIALLSWFWPFKATLDATIGMARYGARVKAMSGVGRFRQWREAMTLAHRWNFSPRTYYVYRFWDREVRDRATTFIQVHELGLLQVQLNAGTDTMTISSKALFDARCLQAGIPSPKVVATLRADSEQWTDGTAALPRRDLFVKRINGQQGIGGERWVHDPATDRWQRRNETLRADELIRRVRMLATEHPLLVQHCLANHPDVARFSGGPLCTFRVMTFLDESDTPTLFAMTMKMARADADVDNIHAGGIACAVDAITGELGSGVGRDPAATPWTIHPDTGQPITGSRVTIHRDVIDLALQTHAKLDVPWSVGWDVAMTPDGPVMIEGNPLWGADIFHAPHGRGLSEEFARALLGRIESKSGTSGGRSSGES